MVYAFVYLLIFNFLYYCSSIMFKFINILKIVKSIKVISMKRFYYLDLLFIYLYFYIVEYKIFNVIIRLIKNFFIFFFIGVILIYTFFSFDALLDYYFSDYFLFILTRCIQKLAQMFHIGYLWFTVFFKWNAFGWSRRYYTELLVYYNNYWDIKTRNGVVKYKYIFWGHLSHYNFNMFLYEIYFWDPAVARVKANFDFYLELRRIGFENFWNIYFYYHVKFFFMIRIFTQFFPIIYYYSLPTQLTWFWRFKWYVIEYFFVKTFFWVGNYGIDYFIYQTVLIAYEHDYYDSYMKFIKIIIHYHYKMWFNILYSYYFVVYDFWRIFFKKARYYFVNEFNLWINYKSCCYFLALDIISFFKLCYHSCEVIAYRYFYYEVYLIINKISEIFNMKLFVSFNDKYYVFRFARDFYKRMLYELSQFFYMNHEYEQPVHNFLRKNNRRKTGFTYNSTALWSFVRYDKLMFRFYEQDIFVAIRRAIYTNDIYYHWWILARTPIFNEWKVNLVGLHFLPLSFWWVYVFKLFIILIVFNLLSFNFRVYFKERVTMFFSPFYEWENFRDENFFSLEPSGWLWLHNPFWAYRFEFYWDRHFKDDLLLFKYDKNEEKLGDYIYDSIDDYYTKTLTEDQLKDSYFTKYYDYFMTRYTNVVTAIDSVFFNLDKRGWFDATRRLRILEVTNFYIPSKQLTNEYLYSKQFRSSKRMGVFFLNHLMKDFLVSLEAKKDILPIIEKNPEVYDFLGVVRKSLFKAYGVFEMNQVKMRYDFQDYKFFEKEFYYQLTNKFLVDHDFVDSKFLLKNIAWTRATDEFIYAPIRVDHLSNKDINIQYREVEDWMQELNTFNSNNYEMFDFVLWRYITPFRNIDTDITGDMIKQTIDFRADSTPDGINYAKAWRFEELGTVAMEQYVFHALDRMFVKNDNKATGKLGISSVGLTVFRRYGFMSSWAVVTFVIPLALIGLYIFEMSYNDKAVVIVPFIKLWLCIADYFTTWPKHHYDFFYNELFWWRDAYNVRYRRLPMYFLNIHEYYLNFINEFGSKKFGRHRFRTFKGDFVVFDLWYFNHKKLYWWDPFVDYWTFVCTFFDEKNKIYKIFRKLFYYQLFFSILVMIFLWFFVILPYGKLRSIYLRNIRSDSLYNNELLNISEEEKKKLETPEKEYELMRLRSRKYDLSNWFEKQSL